MVIKINNDIYENLLVLLTKLNQDNELRIVLIEGKRTLVKMELDNSLESVEKFLIDNGIDIRILEKYVRFFNNILVAIQKNEIKEFTEWVESKQVFECSNLEKIIDDTNSFLKNNPRITEGFDFNKYTLSNLLIDINHQINIIPIENNKRLKGVKLLINYIQNYDSEKQENYFSLDLSSIDLEYLINKLNRIKSELEKVRENVK